MPDFNIAAGYLVTAAPSWTESVGLTVSVPTERVRGLTGRETRRAVGATLRCTMRWRATLSADAFATLRNVAQEAEDRSWVVPCWPLAVRGADWASAPVSGGLLIAWNEGWGTFEAGATITTPSAWDWVAPAIVGNLTITGQAVGSSVGLYAFELVENSAATLALAPGAVSWATGAALADASTPKVWPFRTPWKEKPASGAVEIQVDRKPLGRGRQTADAYFDGVPERPVSCETILTTPAEVGSFLRWVQDVAGDVEAHFIPSLTESARLASTASAGASFIDVTNGAAIGTNQFVHLGNAGAAEWVRVDSVSTNRLNLHFPLSSSWDEMTVVSLAILARHVRNEFELKFQAPGLARVTTAWREVAAEYAPGAGETRGTTIGALGRQAYLFTFSIDRIGSTEVVRLTSYERDVTISAVPWTAARVDHGEIRQSITLDRDELTVSIRWASWMSVLLPGRTDGIVRLTVSRCSVSGGTGSSPAAIFTGDLSGFRTNGPFAELRFRSASGLFDRTAPRRLMQRGCNWVVYSAPCGLSVEDWTFNASVVLASGASVIVGTITRTGGLPTAFGFSDWFAAGYLVRANGEHHYILGSSALSGGQITLNLLVTPATALTVAEAVTIIPGCDGAAGTCKAYASPSNVRGKFDNFSNFGGFPFLPDANPSFTPRKKAATTAGKKGQQ